MLGLGQERLRCSGPIDRYVGFALPWGQIERPITNTFAISVTICTLRYARLSLHKAGAPLIK